MTFPPPEDQWPAEDLLKELRTTRKLLLLFMAVCVLLFVMMASGSGCS